MLSHRFLFVFISISLSGILLCIPDNTAYAKNGVGEGEYRERPNLVNRIKSGITGYVTPKMFGAKGDGKTDDTTPIQYAINYASKNEIDEVRIPKGTYSINVSGKGKEGKLLYIDGEPHYFNQIGAGLILKSNVNLILDNNATLKAIPTDLPEYAILYVGEQHNIVIRGGRIIGDYKEHKGTSGQQGMCVWIQSSNNITVDNCDISQGWGDCIDIGCKWYNDIPYGSNRSSNITIKNCNLHHSRRQGISVVGCEGLVVKDCNIYGIAGSAPEAGIDLEVNFKEYPNSECVFEGLYIYECKGGGIIGYTTPTHGVSIKNSTVQSVQLTYVSNISIDSSEIGYMTFDNGANAPNDYIRINDVEAEHISLYSRFPYEISFTGCTLGNEINMPVLSFMQKQGEANSKESVSIHFDKCNIVASDKQNIFSISPTVYPALLSIHDSKLTASRSNNLFAKEVAIIGCELSGKSLTYDFNSPNVKLVDNTIISKDCKKDINGYLFKFNTRDSVIYCGNNLIGEKKEAQYIVIPDTYQPKCEFENNKLPQYNSLGRIGDGKRIRQSNNQMSR